MGISCTKKAVPVVVNAEPAPKQSIVFKHEKEATIEQVMAMAQSKNKIVFIDFYTTWCGPCKWMDENVFSNQEVVSIYNKKFISYKVDAEDFEGVNTALHYRINAYPTLVFVKPTGEVLHRVEGMMPLESFLQVTNDVLEEQQN